MTQPKNPELALLVLLALHDLARETRPATVTAVAGRTGHARAAVMATLAHLETKGLVDARRVRLTMSGLVIASSLRARAEAALGSIRAA